MNIYSRDVSARPFAASIEKTKSILKPVVAGEQFSSPILTKNADDIASIFAKHIDSPEWTALARKRAEAEEAADKASSAMLLLPADAPRSYDEEEIRKLMFEYHGEAGVTKYDASTRATSYRNELLEQSAAPDRLPIMQRAFDEITDKYSLPRVKVHVKEAMNAAGSYRLGTNEIAVQERHLDEGSTASLAATGSHELTHVEQANLMVRAMADKLGIGVRANASEVEQLKQMHHAELNVNATDALIDGVLEKRGGRTLTFDEQTRAEKLLQGAKDDRKRMRLSVINKVEVDEVDKLKSELYLKPSWKILSKFHGEHLSPESEDTPERSDAYKQLFRWANAEFDNLVTSLKADEATGKVIAPTAAEEKSLTDRLSKFVFEREAELQKLEEKYVDGYYAAYHEVEAHENSDAIVSVFKKIGI